MDEPPNANPCRLRIPAASCALLVAALAWAQHAQPAAPDNPSAQHTPEANAARNELRAMLDAWAGAANIEIAEEAFDRWYATMLAIELYRAEYGMLPQSLGDLPERSRRFAGDLYADIRDEPPLGYVVTDAQAIGFGVGYVLYGFGGDGEDNGGVKHTNMNYGARAHPRRLKGTDFVFNPPGMSPDPGP